MNKETPSLAIVDADKEPIARSERFHRKNLSIIPLLGVFLAIASGLSLMFVYMQKQREAGTGALPAAVIVNGETYYASGWEIAYDACPEGFRPAGNINSTTKDGNYLLDAKFFTNSAIPEWIYIYSPVFDEAVHESMKYVRFVTKEVRFHTLIRYDGVLYESLWTHTGEEYGEPLVDKLPDGCVLIGVSRLEELDRIPQMDFGTNDSRYDRTNIYADPSDPDFLYFSTTWTKYINDEEVNYDGYEVFTRYETDKSG